MRGPIALVQAAWRRGSYKLRRSLFPSEPWVAPEVVRLLRRALNDRTRMIEWGSGVSTIWFAKRTGFLLSLEASPEWYERIRAELGDLPPNRLDYRLEKSADVDPAEGGWPPGQRSRYVLGVDDYPDGSFDLVLIDGAFREACIQVAQRKLKRRGLVILDNSDWNPDSGWAIPPSWELVLRSPYSGTETAVWRTP